MDSGTPVVGWDVDIFRDEIGSSLKSFVNVKGRISSASSSSVPEVPWLVVTSVINSVSILEVDDSLPSSSVRVEGSVLSVTISFTSVTRTRLGSVSEVGSSSVDVEASDFPKIHRKTF